jgi:hypothetical protein
VWLRRVHRQERRPVRQDATILQEEAVFHLVVGKEKCRNEQGQPKCDQSRILLFLSLFLDRGKQRQRHHRYRDREEGQLVGLNPSAHRETSKAQTGQEECRFSAESKDKGRYDRAQIAQCLQHYFFPFLSRRNPAAWRMCFPACNVLNTLIRITLPQGRIFRCAVPAAEPWQTAYAVSYTCSSIHFFASSIFFNTVIVLVVAPSISISYIRDNP